MEREPVATLRVAEGGRIVIPAAVRRHLGLDVGTALVVTVEDDHLTLTNVKAARRRAQQRVRRHASRGVSLSKELMAERRKAAADE